MKMFLSVTLIAFVLASADALDCWTCENVKDFDECILRGRLVRCRPNEQSCESEFRRGSFGELLFKRCKEPHACNNNFIQNPRAAEKPSQCNPSADTSVCRCCCFTDGCNTNLRDCEPLRATTPQNPSTTPLPVCTEPKAPDRGSVQCENAEGNIFDVEYLVGATCEFKCDPGFSPCGFGKTNEDFYRIVILGTAELLLIFWFALIGNATSVCTQSGNNRRRLEFVPAPPTCERCEVIRNTNYLRVECTKRNNVGSTCGFNCVGDTVLFPPRHTETFCQKTATWTIQPPCCLPPCPTLDLGIVLDSSSSVMPRNWETIIRFATSVIDLFEIGKDKGRVGVYRFNSEVDRKTAIALDRFTEDKEALLQAVQAIPYDGRGTLTGNALKYAYETFFRPENGDRRNSQNVLLVVTDGRGQDDEDIAKYAKLLQEEGVLIYAVAIIAERASATQEISIQEQLLTIAGAFDNVIRITRGFDALDDAIAAALGSQVCTERVCPR